MTQRALLIAALALALLAPAAAAHPLGNFSINHLSTVRISDDAVAVHYVLDQAEIPTVTNRRLARAEVIRRIRAAIAKGLRLTVDGRSVPLVQQPRAQLSYPLGQAGLRTTRFELDLLARARAPRSIELADGTYDGRVGWKAIVIEPGSGTAVRTSTPTGDPTGGLRRYPRDLLASPLDRRQARFSVKPGDGTVAAPRNEGGRYTTTRGGGDGFAGLFSDAASGRGVLLLLLLAALGWGALHALSPGHGKAMVAAYLVGTRGTARHAVALGITVTVTHTIGVFALGIVTLGLSQYVLPEDLYPWLTLVSGLMVVAIGAGVLRSRLRWIRGRSGMVESGEDVGPRPDAPPHEHGHEHGPDSGHRHDDGRASAHGGRRHSHHRGRPHSHAPEDLSWRGLLGMGAAAGLIPCPSALVVLLAAISQHEVALGLLLIVAFSVGLAGTLTALGLAVVYARRLLPRLDLGGRVASVLPALSALLIVGVGVMLTIRARPGVV